jgi:hypothetical protein
VLKDIKGFERGNDKKNKNLGYCGQNKKILFASQQEKQRKHILGSGRQMLGMPAVIGDFSKEGIRCHSTISLNLY